MYAREARAQQAAITPEQVRPYPSWYANRGNEVRLSTPSETFKRWKNGKVVEGWLHQPLMPGQNTPWKKEIPGPIRAIYPPSDPLKFDVVYHETISSPGYKNSTYYPAAKQKTEVLESCLEKDGDDMVLTSQDEVAQAQLDTE